MPRGGPRETSASRRSEAPEAATGSGAPKRPTMSIRNGTSRPAQVEATEGGSGWEVRRTDWASEEHALCVVDESGERLAGEFHAHDEAGIRELIALMRALGVRVAIERPDGLLVDRLAEAGLTVLPVHPNKLKATRSRYEAAGGKSDGFDAFCLAELARTDAHRLRALRPDSDETRALRALTRTREDLVSARVRLANELRAQLEAFWPGAAAIFADVDSQIALAFLNATPRPPTPAGWARSGLPSFSPAITTAAGARPRSCSSGCARRPRGAPGRWRSRRAGRPCSGWWRRCGRSSSRSGSSPRRSPARFAPIPTAPSSCHCFGTRSR